MSQIPSDEDFIVITAIVDETDFIRHTILGHHRPCRPGCRLNILSRPGGNIIKNKLLGHTSAKSNRNILNHTAFCIKHLILFRQRHCISGSSDTCRYDRYGVNRSHIRKHMEQNRMSGFMIGRNPFLFVGNDTTLFLSSNTHFNKSSLDICLNNVGTMFFRCHDSRFIHQIFQIGACKSGRRLGDLIQIHIITHRFTLCMNV